MGMRIDPHSDVGREIQRAVDEGRATVNGVHAALLEGMAPRSDPEWPDEKAFQAGVIVEAKKRGWRVYHTKDSRRSEKGFPDLCMVKGCRLIFAELKTATGTVTADQQNWIEDLKQTFSEVFLWRPADWSDILEILS